MNYALKRKVKFSFQVFVQRQDTGSLLTHKNHEWNDCDIYIYIWGGYGYFKTIG